MNNTPPPQSVNPPPPDKCPGCEAGLPLVSKGVQAFHHDYQSPVIECTAYTGSDTQ